jgi:UDP-N-acetylglucosamine 4,6-dehydratase
MLSYSPKIFKNQSILITGGTGTLGRNFTNYCLKNLKLKKIIIFSRDEQKHFKMKNFFKEDRRLRFFLGDIRDYDRLEFATKNVDFILHTAANKHVRLSEYNPMECIKTNVIGTENVVRASLKSSAKRVLLVSSDKAVSPVNLYGSTKSLAEKIFTSANNLVGSQDIRFSTARYGNVIGSEGSVFQLFNETLKNEKVLPLTDEKMTRFWISIDDCIKFILGSFTRMQGGEIFIPKLKSIRIKDLIISLNKNFEITGKNGNEKLDEILFSLEESGSIIEFNKFFILPPLLEYFIGRVSGSGYKQTQKIIKNKYLKTILLEKGRRIKKQEIYSSGNNTFISVPEIKKLNEKIINSINKKNFIFW